MAEALLKADGPRYVLTGGHGVGKTTLVTALETMGEAVVHEAARDLRLLLEASGEPFPTDRDDFESRCLALHRQREKHASRLPSRVFLDRGALDHAVYATLGGWPLSDLELEYCQSVRYDAVFFVEPYANGSRSALTRLERDFSSRLARNIRQAYGDLGMTIHHVPTGDPSARARWVLQLSPGP